MGCWIQQFAPGFEGEKHRHASSAVYYVVEGEGTTIVGDQELHWSARDAFAVPNWTWLRHRNCSRSERAILFAVNDIPILELLCLYREEPLYTLRAAPVPAEQVAGNKRTQ